MADKKPVKPVKPARSNPIEGEEDAKPYIPHTNILGLAKTKFAPLVAQRVALSASIKEQQAELETLNVRILGMLENAHADRVEVAGVKILYTPPGKRKSLSKEKLLLLGVAPKTIEKATIESPIAASIKVFVPKEEKE